MPLSAPAAPRSVVRPRRRGRTADRRPAGRPCGTPAKDWRKRRTARSLVFGPGIAVVRPHVLGEAAVLLLVLLNGREARLHVGLDVRAPVAIELARERFLGDPRRVDADRLCLREQV